MRSVLCKLAGPGLVPTPSRRPNVANLLHPAEDLNEVVLPNVRSGNRAVNANGGRPKIWPVSAWQSSDSGENRCSGTVGCDAPGCSGAPSQSAGSARDRKIRLPCSKAGSGTKHLGRIRRHSRAIPFGLGAHAPIHLLSDSLQRSPTLSCSSLVASSHRALPNVNRQRAGLAGNCPEAAYPPKVGRRRSNSPPPPPRKNDRKRCGVVPTRTYSGTSGQPRRCSRQDWQPPSNWTKFNCGSIGCTNDEQLSFNVWVLGYRSIARSPPHATPPLRRASAAHAHALT